MKEEVRQLQSVLCNLSHCDFLFHWSFWYQVSPGYHSFLTVAQTFLSEDSQTFLPLPGLDCCALSSIVSIGTIAGRIVVFQIFPFCLVMPSLSSPGCSGSVITALKLLTQEPWGVQSGQVVVLASSRWNCVSSHCSFRLYGLQNSRA